MALATCAAAALLMQAGWLRHGDEEVVPWGLAVALVFGGALTMAASTRLAAGARAGWAGAFKVARVESPRDYVTAALMCAGVGFVCAAAASTLALWAWQRDAAFSREVSVGSCIARVEGDPRAGASGWSSTVVLTDAPGDSRSCRVRATSGEAYEDGDVLRVVGRLDSLGDTDWDRSRFMKGEVGSLDVRAVLACEEGADKTPLGVLRAAAIQCIEPSRGAANAMLAGTVCGRVTELADEDAYAAFTRCGLTHLVAVSGSHLAYIAALVEAVLRRSRAGRGLRKAILLAAMGSYVVLSGGAPSAMRSVSMVGMATAALLGGRRAHAPSALSLTVSLLVVLDPGVVFDLGFQLSAMSVLFITVFASYVTFTLERLRVPALLAEPLALTLVAQWATLPLTIPVFGEVSLIAPVANLIVGPIMSALLVTGLVSVALATAVQMAASVFGPAVSLVLGHVGVLMWAPRSLAQLAMFLAESFARVPFASISVPGAAWLPLAFYGAAVLLYVRWRAVSPRGLGACASVLAALLVLHVVRWTLFAPAGVTVLDVGQGDAILLRDGAHAVVVDAGVDDATRAALARNHVFRLDAVVVTHWDRDHWGGLPDLAQTIPVDSLIVAEGAADGAPEEVRDLGVPIVELREGDALGVGAFSCAVVWPDAPVGGEENADSLVLDVGYRQGGRALSMLLTGDTERDELARYVREVGDIDVLKLGHHGSKVSVDSASLDVLDPEVAIASAGEGNSYGHPDPTCVDVVEKSGARFLCTKDVGDITITPGEQGVRVTAGGG